MNQKTYFLRLIIIFSLFLAMFGLLVLNLWDQQVRTGEAHRDKISHQSIRKIRHPAGRGRIYSSDGTIVAGNRPSSSLVFHLAEMRQPGARKNTIKYILECAERAARRTGRTNRLTEEIINRHLNKKPAIPIIVLESLDMKEITSLKEMLPRIEGGEIITEPQRYYPDGKDFAHLVGYMGREDRTKAEDKDEYFYYDPDMKGQQGLEKRFDTTFDLGDLKLKGLRGTPGKSLVRVDYLGYVFDVISAPVASERGNDIVLTVDHRAQSIATELMEGKKGSFILLDARTGAVLALVSSPCFDPSIFIPEISPGEYARLRNDKDKPFVNRALTGTYMPGSVLKPLIGLAALKNGTSPDDIVNCEGAVRIGNSSIKCWIWKYGVHGEQTLPEAIKNSCNAYFITVGRKTGLDKILATLEAAGLGKKTGIPLPEQTGFLPSRKLKMELYNESWTEFDTALLSIGQGMILVTPIQAAVYAAALANGGKVLEPYVVKELRNKDRTLYRRGPSVVKSLLADDPNLLVIVKKGMFLAANDPKGTARKAKNNKITLFGKTGTAEVGKGVDRHNNTWYIGFGQKGENLYAFSVLVEEGLSGGSTCAPVVSEFFEKWIE